MLEIWDIDQWWEEQGRSKRSSSWWCLRSGDGCTMCLLRTGWMTGLLEWKTKVTSIST